MARRSTNPHETIIRNLDALSRAELEDLQRLIGEKLADMRAASALLVDVFTAEEKQPKVPTTWIEAKYIPGPNGKQHGPYYYERWRDESGKMRSKYLKGYGKTMKQAPATTQEAE